MNSIFAFVFVLGVLVFVHELGHFLAARRIGIRVLTFSLGFGPKLLSVTRGDTEYCLSLIPLGGYVKMAGENPEDNRTGAPDEFLSKTKWERFQVLVMGPIMNLALAWLVMAAVLYQGAQLPAFDRDPIVIGSVTANSVAAESGLKAGDRIVGVDGQTVSTWEDFSIAVIPKANKARHARNRARRPAIAAHHHAARGRQVRRRARLASCRSCTRRFSRPIPANRRSSPASSRMTSSWRPTASATSRASA